MEDRTRSSHRSASTVRTEFSLSTISVSRTFEALKQDEKREDVLRRLRGKRNCRSGDFEILRRACGRILIGDSVAGGLTRLHSIDPPPPAFVNLSSQSKKYLLSIARLCPDLLRQQDGSSIASADTDGTLYTVELEHDKTEELAAMRVAMTSAFNVAKARGMDKEDFETEAQKLFNTEAGEYPETYNFVVPDDFQPQASNDGATAESHFDAMSKAAVNAFASWCKQKSIGSSDRLFITVFKQM